MRPSGFTPAERKDYLGFRKANQPRVNQSVTRRSYRFQMDTLEAILSDPIVLTAAIAIGIALIAGGLSGSRQQMGRRARFTGYRPSVDPKASRISRFANNPSHAAGQLRAVMLATYAAKSVLSFSERKVLHAAESAVAELRLPWRVMAQVALGEVLESPCEEGFQAINAKRVDLLLIDERAWPIAAIEYQGQGHYQGTAPARDAIKKEALRKAGIGFIEITFDHGPDDVRREIARIASVRRAAVAGKQEFRTLIGKAPDQESAAQAA
jgi:hypothetical protein